ncbi:hypothetical protein ABE937_05340 [Enterococcus casseliflavus]|uniref:sensor histidine kinase n=1 Tax=Enterococcus casseliflavus TaxID=37734 RepID=UPI003D6B1DEE
MENQKTKWQVISSVLFIIYLILVIYFFLFTAQTPYLGIRAHLTDEGWVVKRIYNGGLAAEKDIRENDQLIEINSSPPENDKILTNWLIVEQADSVTVNRGNKTYIFYFSSKTTYDLAFVILVQLSLLVLFFLLSFYRKQLLTKRSEIFYLCIASFTFLLLSTYPSSMGNSLGRLIFISCMSSFPTYFEIFNMMNNARKNKKKIPFSIAFLIFNCLLGSYAMFFPLPYYLAEYLTTGIFKVWGFIMILQFLSNSVVLSKKKKQDTTTEINIILIFILSITPLLFLYILPNGWNAPYYLAIVFILLPLVSIFHRLTIDRLLKFRYKVSPIIIYLTISTILSLIIILTIALLNYVPMIYLLAYLFLLLFSLLPLFEDFFHLANTYRKPLNSLTLFSAVESERESISTFIHDKIIQDTIHLLRSLESYDTDSSKEVVSQHLDELIYDLRELCTDIYPLLLQEIGLEKTLVSVIDQIQKKHPVIIQFTYDKLIHSESPQMNNFILRSLKEIINNSILHGKATELILTNYIHEKMIVFEIIDNGIFDNTPVSKGQHFGLNVIREKLLLLSGELIVEQSPTTIKLKIPETIFKGGN